MENKRKSVSFKQTNLLVLLNNEPVKPILRLTYTDFSNLMEISIGKRFYCIYGTKYSRMDHVKFVEDSL